MLTLSRVCLLLVLTSGSSLFAADLAMARSGNRAAGAFGDAHLLAAHREPNHPASGPVNPAGCSGWLTLRRVLTSWRALATVLRGGQAHGHDP